MEPLYYMEYTESKKSIEETFEAYYKYRDLKKPKLFRTGDIKTKAIDKAADRYKEIKRISRKDRVVKASFYEDYFECVTGDVRQEYQYEEIEAIYETDKSIAFVAGKNRKKDAFLALKKGSVKGKGLADLKEYVLGRCTKVKGSVQYI